MYFPRPFSIFLASSLLSVSAAAQQPQLAGSEANPQRDPQALALVQQAVAAMGGTGLAALRSSQITLLASGRYSRFNTTTPVSFSFRLKLLGLDQIRWEMDGPEGSVVILVRQGAGWHITPRGTGHLSVGALSGRQLELVPLFAITDWLRSPDVGVESPGIEVLNGRELHRISAYRLLYGERASEYQEAFKKMSRKELYLDRQTFLPVQLRYNEHPVDWRVNVPIDVVFSNYQRVDGFVIPLTITRYLRNQKLDEYQFQNFSLGAPINPDDFALR